MSDVEEETPMCNPVKTVERKPPPRLLLYYITDRRQFPGSPEKQEQRLLEKIRECAAAGVDYIQLREKDLSGRAIMALAQKAMKAIPSYATTKLLINSRTDVALAAGAHGVHLPGNDLHASEVRAIMLRTGQNPVIGASVHSLEEVALAESHGADLAVFGPVFEKEAQHTSDGLALLRRVCNRSESAIPPMPVLALGGVSAENSDECIASGAAGIAGIRVFQHGDVTSLVAKLRSNHKTRIINR